ncbi:MAG: beta strand repeat-containing protein [Limisphaerales bacterium]
MKNHKLLTLALCFAASTLLAQTADQYVAAGRVCLTQQNLSGAYSNFNAAVTLSSTNETANAFLAVTRLLVLPQQPAGSNFLNNLGFPKSGRNLYNWTSTLPKDANGDTILPTNNTSVAIAFFRTNVMVALGASGTNLSRITDPGFTLSLTAAETDSEAVTVDYGDFLLMQAELYTAEFLGYTLNAQNCNVVARQLQLLSQTNGLTIQAVLAIYPSLLTQNNAADLTNSEAAFTNVIAFYLAASDFIRNTRPPGQGLFILEPKEVAGEAVFRDSLTNVLLSLNGPVPFNTNTPASLDLGNYFAGTKTLRSLLPQFNGSSYVNNTLPDYTFGGILLNVPAYLTEAKLRQIFYSYAGIYGGQVYDINFNDPNAGMFGVLVSTNGQATVVGYDFDSFQNFDGEQSGGVGAQFNVDPHGNWQFNSNSVAGVSGSGWMSKDGSFSGELDFTNGDSVQLNGSLQSPLGPFQSAAGNYSGIWSGTHQGQAVSGTLKAVLSAHGQLVYCLFHNGAQNDGGLGQLDSNNQFTTADTASGSTVSGTLTNATLKIGGTFSNSGGSGTWTLSRSANVPFDAPPVITTNLPSPLTASLGTNVTLSLVVTGSPPMCYQWYDNNNVIIPSATTNTLTINNIQYGSAGTYSVTINNCAGGTNAVVTLAVTAETVPPTNQITAPTPGLQVSNAFYTVTGKAGDNVAVSNVLYQLNNTGWNPATPASANQWSNWTAQVTLVQGSNTVQAYAVDTSGNVSKTNSVIFDYVVSAVLTVNTNGTGTISPNYNGAWLQIGQNYSMTATAGTGFSFTGWTGSITTNGATLQFTMASNLTFTANFVDVTRPTNTITAPTAGQRWSNSTFTVTGTASDNVQVSSVVCQINGSGWNNAVGTTSWSALVNLLPGTNLIRAYAVDLAGNKSTTNSVSMDYVATNQLQVQMSGLGTISPNYSNAWLEIGRNYSITSAPASGFVFTNWVVSTNWIGGTTISTTNLQFMMASNLTLQVNFADTNKPTVSITNLAAGQRVSNAVFTVKGTAGDNWQVSNVVCQINGGGWNLATNINHWTNWAAGVTLMPGTNVVQAYASDTSGNLSATNSVSFQFVVTNQLQIRVIGLGTFSPNYSNAWLEIGRNYSITSAPASGFVFSNWVTSTNWIGGATTTKTNLLFMMASNLTLQATFADVTRPTLTITAPTAGQHMANALATVTGTAGDNWKVSAVWYQLTNKLLTSGWYLATTTNSYTNWTATVTLAVGTNTVKAYAVDLGGNYSATSSVSVLSSNTFKLQLDFALNQPLTSTGLIFTLQISSNLNGHLQFSTNLVNWATLTNFVGTNTTLNFRDPAATNSNSRFYRAVIP